MASVRHESVAAERLGEDAFAGRDRLILRHRSEAEFAPGRLRTLDDECRSVRVELVGMRPDPAVLGLFKDEGEGVVKLLMRAEPDELALADVGVRSEARRELVADLRIQAIRRNDQIMRLGKFRRALDLGLETQFHAQLPSPLLQQDQQLLASDAAEAMAGRNDALPAIVHRNVV